jgi:diguanylate cyclase (GGDEF)-like protein
MLALAAGLLLVGVFVLLQTNRVLSRRYSRELAQSDQAMRSLTAQLEDTRSRLDQLAMVDSLTDLVNRRGLERVLQIEVNRAKRGGSPMVAMLLNCDNFKRLNDVLGHAVGDVALKEMVGRITSTLRPSDYVARVGGDEFVVLLTDTQFAEAMMIAERVRLAVAESPIRNSHDTIQMTASIGVASVPYEVNSVEEILSLTRHALKRSKGSGKNRVSSSDYVEGITGNGDAPEVDIVQILGKGESFRCVKHGIFRLADEYKVGYELLTRGPAGPFEAPYDFFRVAIENNILTLVDLRCLKAAVEFAGKLEQGQGMKFDVNLFPSTIIDIPIETLVSMFPEDRSRGTFCVEISEQQFIGDPSYLRNHTAALKKAGVQVAIDDVGFGRSSLESLILLEPDVVKVDIKFVAGISMDPQKQRLLKRLIGVVQALGAELIAEGIETREDLQVLKEMGVEYGQGYLWGVPS